MPGFDLVQVLGNLRYVGLLGLLNGIDWLIGIVLAFRAGTFDLRLLPDTLKEWVTYLLGLGLIAVATGIRLALGDLDISPAMQLFFTGLTIAYGVKIIADLKDKFSAFTTRPAARRYFGKEP